MPPVPGLKNKILMNSASWIFISLIIAAACAYGGYKYGDSIGQSGEADMSASEEEKASVLDKIVGQGNLQPARGTINIVAPPGERIEKLLVKLGDEVKKDDELGILASQKVRQLELDLAKAQQKDAVKKAEMLTKANRIKAKTATIASGEVQEAIAKVENQESTIIALKKGVASAEKMLGKLVGMRANPLTRELVGEPEIETQQGLVNKLTAQLQQAEGEVLIAQQAIKRSTEMADEQMKLAELNASAPGLSVPTETLNLAIKGKQMALDATTLKSPVSGRVLDLGIYEGDTVMNRPIMLIADTSKMICVAEITDTQLKNVKVGQAVTMISDAFENSEIKGEVIEIGSMIAPPSMKDPNPFAAVDRKTGSVKIAIDSEHCPEAGQFVNLQVEVCITTGDAKKAEKKKVDSKPSDEKTAPKSSNKPKVPAEKMEPETDVLKPAPDAPKTEGPILKEEDSSSQSDPILELSN